MLDLGTLGGETSEASGHQRHTARSWAKQEPRTIGWRGHAFLWRLAGRDEGPRNAGGRKTSSAATASTTRARLWGRPTL